MQTDNTLIVSEDIVQLKLSYTAIRSKNWDNNFGKFKGIQ